jgi:C4-dicarboxylate-binding protein DctP
MITDPCRRRLYAIAAAMFALVVGTPGAALAQDALRLRISSQLPPSSPVSQSLELWKARMEEAGKDRLKIEIYHNSQLYKDSEVFPAVQSKSIEMGLVILAQFSAYDPIFGIFDLPGLFHSYPQAVRVFEGDLGKDFTQRLQKLGVQPMYWPLQGFVEIATTKRVLNAPADFRGLKLRTHSKELARMAQLVGASPTVIAPSEVSTALSRNTIDGLTATLASYYGRKWFEAAPQVTTSHFGLVGVVIVMNRAVWDALPPDLKTAAVEASRAANAFATEHTTKEDAQVLAALTKNNVQVSRFSDQGREEFARITAPMYEEFFKATGPAGRQLVEYVRSVK